MKLNPVFAIGLLCIAASAFAKPRSRPLLPEIRRENLLQKVTGKRGRIIEGNAATRGQFPWQAALTSGSQFICGGSLISPQAVITAAWCIDGKDGIEVTVGTLYSFGGDTGSETQISNKLIVHEGYSAMLHYDEVGLVLVNSPFTVTDTIKPIRLPAADQLENTFENYQSVACGWGFTELPRGRTYLLQYTNQTIISNLKCEDDLGGYVHASNICSVGNPTGTLCEGDLGGGLAVLDTDGEYILVGVANTGSCISGKAFMFSRVTSFMSVLSGNLTIQRTHTLKTLVF